MMMTTRRVSINQTVREDHKGRRSRMTPPTHPPTHLGHHQVYDMDIPESEEGVVGELVGRHV